MKHSGMYVCTRSYHQGMHSTDGHSPHRHFLLWCGVDDQFRTSSVGQGPTGVKIRQAHLCICICNCSSLTCGSVTPHPLRTQRSRPRQIDLGSTNLSCRNEFYRNSLIHSSIPECCGEQARRIIDHFSQFDSQILFLEVVKNGLLWSKEDKG